MTFKASVFCPYCHRHTALSVVKSIDGKDPRCIYLSEKDKKYWWMGKCNNCHELCLVYDNGVRVYPLPLPTPTDVRIPEDLKKDLDEAKICYSIGAYRGSAVLARRVVQVCCIDKGADKNKKLHQQIEELYDSRVITEDIKKQTTVIRWIGNDAAHPSSNIVDKEEADDVVKLAEQFLHVVYVTSAIAKERIQKREN